MSLHDVDKLSDNRIEPMVNAPDGVANRMAHATLGITLKDAGSTVSSRIAMKDGKVEVFDSSDGRVARVGVRETDTQGAVDVAKPGGTI